MDSFPDNFTRKVCNDAMTINQTLLICDVRKTFYDTVQLAVNNCNQFVHLEFPDKLWNEHRRTILSELLLRFGQLKIKQVSNTADVTRRILKMEDVNVPIKKVIIEFAHDC